MDIEFSCDKCGQRLVVDEKHAGMSVDCPKCQANLPVPCKFQCVEGAAMLGKDSERGVFPSKSSQELQTRPEEEAVPKKSPSSNALSDFFAFRMTISSILARTIYLLGAIVITIAGLAVMFVEGLAQFRWPIAEGLIIIVGGNLVWRVACEFWNIIFSIHDRLASIEKSLKQK